MKKPYAYVGMMASRGRSALLKKQMGEDGFDRKVLDEIHTPVGLDIHAETPEEIAVSIVSELIKEKNSVRKTSGYDAELLDYLVRRSRTQRRHLRRSLQEEVQHPEALEQRCWSLKMEES